VWLPDAVLAHVEEVAEEPDLSGTRYRLVRRLGRGGMGVVYAAEDLELGREVALKVSSAADVDGALCERLRREARILAHLEHPGIVPVHDVGVLPDGRVYYVMKLVRGERLDAWTTQNTDPRAALRLFQRLCEAVAFAHAAGVIHRDLKPENVMVGAFGEALVMDFGIAKVLSRPASAVAGGDACAQTTPARLESGATAAGTVMGTRGYMAPEQASGDVDRVDARADVYALGAVLSFLLARRPPPEARWVLDTEVPKPLSSICAKATAEDPAARYATAMELADDVGHWLDGEPVRAHRENPLERLARFASNNRVVLALLGAYLALRVLLILLAR
jgi:serine/threonine-protein kinase